MAHCFGQKGQRRLKPGFGFTEETAKYRLRERTKCVADDRKEHSFHGRSSSLIYDFHSGKHYSFPPDKDYKRKQTTRKMSDCRNKHNGTFAHFPYANVHGKNNKTSLKANGIAITLSRTNQKQVSSTGTEMPLGLPGQNQSQESQSDDNRLPSVEMDTILPHDIHFKPVSPGQLNVSPDFMDCSDRSETPRTTTKLGNMPLWSKKKDPDEEDEIYIPHKEQTDSQMGDKFGARLVSYNPSDDYKYHRHFLCNIAEGFPAQKMKIENKDELVLLNNAFVPVLTHADVLNLFHNVKVDGKTRLCLVIRRCMKGTSLRNKKKIKSFQWIQTSAVLAPEYNKELGPDVFEKRFEATTDKYIYRKSCHKFQVKGISEYLSISPSEGVQATVNTEHDDDTKIMVDVRVWFADRSYHNETSLYTEHDGQCWYLNIDGEQVKASKECQWIQYKQPEGTFSLNEHYVACNKNTRTFVALLKPYLDQHRDIFSYVFKDYTISERNSAGLDEPDMAVYRSPVNLDVSDTDENGEHFDDSGASLLSSSHSSLESSHNLYDSGGQPSSGYTSGNEEGLRHCSSEMTLTFGSGPSTPKTPSTPMGLLTLV